MHFERLAWVIDRDFLLDRIDQPSELCAIGYPLLHLDLEFSQVIASASEVR